MAQIALDYSAAQINAAVAKINNLVSVIEGSIVQLYDGSTAIYPYTKAEAVFFDNDTSKNLADEFSTVKKEVIYDVSAHNDDAVFESLSALLSNANLNTLIPPAVRCGGMSIRFIQGSVPNSDNKYVQARCMAQNFTTDVTQWQGVDNEPVVGSNNLVNSDGIARRLSIATLVNKINWLSANSHNDTLIYLGKVEVGDKFIYRLKADSNVNASYFGIYTAQPSPAYKSTVAPMVSVRSEDIVNNEKEYLVTVVEASQNARVFIWLNDAVEGVNIEFSVSKIYAANLTEFNERITDTTEIAEESLSLAEENRQILTNILGDNKSIEWLSANSHNTTLLELGEVSVGDIIIYRISSDSNVNASYFGIYTAQPSPAYKSTVAPMVSVRSEDIVNNEKEYLVTVVEASQNARVFIWLNNAIEGININLKATTFKANMISDLIEEHIAHIQSVEQPIIIDKSLVGCKNVQKPVSDIELVVMYGQSLAAGQQTGPSVTRTPYKDTLMIGTSQWFWGGTASSFNSLVSSLSIPADKMDQSNIESPIVNIANAAKRLLDATLIGLANRTYCASNCAVGGRSIELLSKNNPNNNGQHYNNYINILNNFKRLSEADNKTYNLSAICWMQGEFNATSTKNQGWQPNTPSTNNREEYKKLLIGGTTIDGVTHKGLIYDMMEDAVNTLGQEYNPIFLSSQIGYPWDIEDFDQPIAMAFVDAQSECKDITIVSPNYRVTDRGGHLDANGSRWIGEFFAKVYYYKVICGVDWRPLRPISLKKVSEKYIDIVFDVPVRPLKFDTNQVRSVTNYGFEVKKNGSNAIIQDIVIVASNVVRIELESVSIQDEIEVTYGRRYGNLCDSDDWEAFAEYKDMDALVENPEGVSFRPTFEPKDKNGNVIYNKKYPCENFCLRFYYKINSGQDYLYVY